MCFVFLHKGKDCNLNCALPARVGGLVQFKNFGFEMQDSCELEILWGPCLLHSLNALVEDECRLGSAHRSAPTR